MTRMLEMLSGSSSASVPLFSGRGAHNVRVAEAIEIGKVRACGICVLRIQGFMSVAHSFRLMNAKERYKEDLSADRDYVDSYHGPWAG